MMSRPAVLRYLLQSFPMLARSCCTVLSSLFNLLTTQQNSMCRCSRRAGSPNAKMKHDPAVVGAISHAVTAAARQQGRSRRFTTAQHTWDGVACMDDQSRKVP